MATCDPNAGRVSACTLAERLKDTGYVTESLLKWEHLIFIAYIVIFLVLARYTYQLKLFFFLRSRKDVEGFTCVPCDGPRAAAGAHGGVCRRNRPPVVLSAPSRPPHAGSRTVFAKP